MCRFGKHMRIYQCTMWELDHGSLKLFNTDHSCFNNCNVIAMTVSIAREILQLQHTRIHLQLTTQQLLNNIMLIVLFNSIQQFTESWLPFSVNIFAYKIWLNVSTSYSDLKIHFAGSRPRNCSCLSMRSLTNVFLEIFGQFSILFRRFIVSIQHCPWPSTWPTTPVRVSCSSSSPCSMRDTKTSFAFWVSLKAVMNLLHHWDQYLQ